ncbi:unnamed protein product [Phytophthora fragariaefolia]|uniref:Unnamed protein product n=1 Tax=Phytophthora fragariaefolia TaxID=1490495 RepID=A0A9W6YC19_9STRA|nr:unnamed protein product [Phytophthora fragariaefolia]
MGSGTWAYNQVIKFTIHIVPSSEAENLVCVNSFIVSSAFARSMKISIYQSVVVDRAIAASCTGKHGDETMAKSAPNMLMGTALIGNP